MKLLTTKKERLIRMKPGRKVSQRDKILFPIAGLLITALVAPGTLPLLGMLFFGNLLKESPGVTGRLAKTASSAVLDIATILLGLAVGASTTAQVFLTRQSILIFALGCLAFAVATAGGVLFAKLMNLVSRTKINPLIGAAGVSAVPDSARVVHHVGQEEDPNNYLLQHAMGPTSPASSAPPSPPASSSESSSGQFGASHGPDHRRRPQHLRGHRRRLHRGAHHPAQGDPRPDPPRRRGRQRPQPHGVLVHRQQGRGLLRRSRPV
jgi:hypothetical protein